MIRSLRKLARMGLERSEPSLNPSRPRNLRINALSGEHFADNFAVHVREAALEAIVVIGEALVVQSQEV